MILLNKVLIVVQISVKLLNQTNYQNSIRPIYLGKEPGMVSQIKTLANFKNLCKVNIKKKQIEFKRRLKIFSNSIIKETNNDKIEKEVLKM